MRRLAAVAALVGVCCGAAVPQAAPWTAVPRQPSRQVRGCWNRAATAISLRGGATQLSLSGEASSSLKLGLQASLTLITTFSWLVPLRIPTFTESPKALGLANAFSGGVFLALACGHLLPHAAQEFAAALPHAPIEAPFVAVLGGYLLIFVVEKVAFNTHAFLDAQPNSAGQKGARASLLLLGAIGVHSLVETMALGVQSEARSAWLLAASIGLHAPAEAIALLVALLKAGLSRRHIIALLSLFSALGPLGVGLGITAKKLVGGVFESVMVAVTAGTFLYVGATEVIAEEFETPEGKWPKLASLLCGMGVIAAVLTLTSKLEAQF